MRAPFSETIPAPLSPLVGRASDIQSVLRSLADPDVRLLVLTGTGGVGKTRLATAIAREIQAAGEMSSFPDGVAFVSLVGVSDPDLLLPTIASTLEIPVLSDLIPALILALQDRRMLLVLDNFEQIIEATGHVVSLLRTLPRLSILVTSRRVLRVAGEVDFPVPTLALPDEGTSQRMSDLAESPAVSLFIQRAGSTGNGQPRFGDQDASTLAAICRRLDGLPLAIELAAARTVILSPDQLLTRLDDRLGLLTRGGPDLPVRHQTLRATIGWSYDLLEETQRAWLRRLSVFPDGFTLDAAIQVVSGAGLPEVLAGRPDAESDLASAALWNEAAAQVDVLEELVGHSLIGVDRTVPEVPRFTMLETVRAFSAEQLRKAGEERPAQAAMAAVFLNLGRSVMLISSPKDREGWVESIGREYDNIRAAMSWFLTEGTAQLAVEMASSLWRFWDARALATEGANWLQMALDRPGDVTPQIRGVALNNLANLLSDRSDLESARSLYTESLEIVRVSGSRRDVGDVLNNIGLMAMWLGDYQLAAGRFRESIAIRKETGDDLGLSIALLNAGDNALHAGDLAQGIDYLDAARRIRERHGDRRGLAYVDYLTGRGRMYQNSDEAMPLFERSLAVFLSISDTAAAASVLTAMTRFHARHHDIGAAVASMQRALAVIISMSDRRGLAGCLELIAEIAMERGRPLRAARLLGAAANERQLIRVPIARLLRSWHLDLIARTKAAAGEALYQAAWTDGRETGVSGTLPDAELELREITPAIDGRLPAAPSSMNGQSSSEPARQLGTLTHREIEVLQQVAKGLGDREIGYELGIGQRTVSTHVASLLTKLAVPSRSAAAAAAVRMGVA